MMKRVTYILAMVFAIGCGHVRGQKNTTAEQAREAPVYYKECDGVWNDTCEVFHYWVELNEFDISSKPQAINRSRLGKSGAKKGIHSKQGIQTEYLTVI